jgi:hypothetical protein
VALNAGSITVTDDGSHTGSGLALALYEVERTRFPADLSVLPSAYQVPAWQAWALDFAPSLVGNPETLSAEQKATAEASYLVTWRANVVGALRSFAVRAGATAEAITKHFDTNADVRIPANALGAGVPGSTQVLAGALE